MQATVFKCKLTAILSADAVGYSRLMNDDEMDREIDHLPQKKEIKKPKRLKTALVFLLGTITVPAAGSGWYYWQDSSSRSPVDASPENSILPPPKFRKASIAVLPFTNLSGNVEQEYFRDGVIPTVGKRIAAFHRATLGVVATVS